MLRASDHYIIDDVRHDRVSSILSALASPSLYKWQEKMTKQAMIDLAIKLYVDYEGDMGSEMLRKSLAANSKDMHAADEFAAVRAEIGNGLHNWVEWYLKREMNKTAAPEPKYEDESILKLIAKWKDWRDHTLLVPEHVEPVVFSRKHLCAGTTDLIARVGKSKVRMCLDWKSSKAIWPKHILQCATYVGFAWECKLAKPKCGMVVRVGDNGAVDEEEVDPWREHYEVFLSLLEVYRWSVKMEDENRVKWDRKRKNVPAKVPLFDETQPAPEVKTSPLLPGISEDSPLF